MTHNYILEVTNIPTDEYVGKIMANAWAEIARHVFTTYESPNDIGITNTVKQYGDSENHPNKIQYTQQ